MTTTPEAARLVDEAKLRADAYMAAASFRNGDKMMATERAKLHAAIDALAALSQPDEAPSGYKLVPMRPTPEMIDAAIRTINARKTYGTKGHNIGQMLAEEWIAMLHAAPAAMSKEQP